MKSLAEERQVLVAHEDGVEPRVTARRRRHEPAATLVASEVRELTESELQELAELTARARAANQRGVELLLDMKDILARAHALFCRVGRLGEYGEWVARNFPDLSQRTAERYLKVHQVFRDEPDETLLKFEVTALYLLCEEKTPRLARKWAVEEALRGATMTAQHARLLIAAASLIEKATSNGEHKPHDEATKATPQAPRMKPIETAGGLVIVRPKDGVLNVVAALREAMESVGADGVG